MQFRWSIIAVLAAAAFVARAADTARPADKAVDEVIGLWRSGKTNEALASAERALASEPKNSRLLSVRSQMHLRAGRLAAAEADLTSAIAIEPDSGWLRQERGQLRFRDGRIEGAVEDFDKAVLLAPGSFPHNWQRGIALYYAGRFGDGRKQFEAHQTVNRSDVENAAWHFLCTARDAGIGEARKHLIPIEGDPRIPMREVQQLFAGKADAAAVLAAAEKGDESDREEQRFYAHLYLGLYFEATGETEQRDRHIREAARLADPRNYMGAVAKVHEQRLNKKPAVPASKPTSKP